MGEPTCRPSKRDLQNMYGRGGAVRATAPLVKRSATWQQQIALFYKLLSV